MDNNTCVDAGGKYCPCHLAETKDCIACSNLNKNEVCECKWQGVCIYQNYLKSKCVIGEERKETCCEIIKTIELEENLYLVDIEVPNELALELVNPGVYVFMRSENRKSDKFNSPISVLRVRENILTVALKLIGPKTKDLLKGEKIIIKGPYSNGIFGISNFKKLKNSRAVLISSGLSQVTLINAANQLLKNKNEIKIFLDEDNLNLKIVKDYFYKKENVELVVFSFRENMDRIRHELSKDIGLVFSAGSNEFNKSILNVLDEVNEKVAFSITNNNLICCGEGLCGSCIVKVEGKNIRTCKTQIEPRKYLRGALK